MSLAINKQKMKYSKQGQRIVIYETDDDGNIIYYIDEEGNKIPLEKDTIIGFSEPIIFYANIAFSGGEAQSQEYGYDTSDYDAIIITDRNSVPFEKGDIIWLTSDVGHTDDGYVDNTTADFIVSGVKLALRSVKYMLKAVTK